MRKQYLWITALLYLVCMTVQAGQTLQDDDYIAIQIEAEDYSSKDDRWYLNSDSETPDVERDADGNHSSSANGSAYMEVLPDYRQVHEDVMTDGYWNYGWQGPPISYDVNFPEPGRYLVYMRSFSTGTEDNSVHAGLNGSWKIDGQAIQVPCSNKRSWVWANLRRSESNHCGDKDYPAFIDVTSAGAQTLSISGREDGYELDSIFLIKNLNPESRVCAPNSSDSVNCKNGVLKFEDGFVDIKMLISATDTHARQGDTLSFEHTVSNEDKRDTATNVKMVVDFTADVSFESADSADCTASGGQVICEVGKLAPLASKTYTIQYRFPEKGEINYTATTTSTETEGSPSNNTSSLGLTIYRLGAVADIAISGSANKNPVKLNDPVTYTFSVVNVGLDASSSVDINATLPDGAEIVKIDSRCSEEPIRCTLGALDVDQKESISVTVKHTQAGQPALSATVSAASDENQENDTDVVVVLASDGEVFEEKQQQISVEAEKFVVNQSGQSIIENAWFIVSNGTKPDSSVYQDNGLQSKASKNSYVVALGDAPVSGHDQGAALSYRVFFNTTGVYYLKARVALKGKDSRMIVALDESFSDAQILKSCDMNSEWTWIGSTELSGECQSDQLISFNISEPGEHVLTFVIQDMDLMFDKFALSSDSQKLYEAEGDESAIYADKDLDISITVDTETISLNPDSKTIIPVTLTNNDTVYAATNIEVILEGQMVLDEGQVAEAGCQLIEKENVQSLICPVQNLSPSQSLIYDLPVSVISSGEFDVTLTVSADQTDSDSHNNQADLILKIGSIAAAVPKSSSGGSFNWLLLVFLSVGFGLRKVYKMPLNMEKF